MGTPWDAVAGLSSGGRVESGYKSLDVSKQTPEVLSIVGRDDNVTVRTSDRFEIKYRFYLSGAKGKDPAKTAKIFSDFEVSYSGGNLKSKVPSSGLSFTGAGVEYEIGLPPGVQLSTVLEDGDVRLIGITLGGLKVYSGDGDIEISDAKINGNTDIQMADGNVAISKSFLRGGRIFLDDGNVKVDLTKDTPVNVRLEERGDGRHKFDVEGCKSSRTGVVCDPTSPELLISIADGNVNVERK